MTAARRARSAPAVAGLALVAATGAAAVVGASDLVTVWAGLEAVRLAVVALAGFGRDGRWRAPGTRVFAIEGVSAGLTLHGLALLEFSGAGASPVAVAASLALFLAGPALRLLSLPVLLAAEPSGRETGPAAAAIVGVVGLVTGVSAVERVLAILGPVVPIPGDLLPGGLAAPTGLIAALALALIAGGGLGAFRARRPSILVAWLTTASGGTALLGLCVDGTAGPTSARVAGAVAAAAVPGALLVLGDRASIRGLIAASRGRAALAAIFLLALAGLPPTGGFAARFLVLGVVVDAGFPVLAGLATIAGLPALAAVAVSILDMREAGPPTGEESGAPGRVALAVSVVLALATLAALVSWGTLASLAAACAAGG